MKTTNIVILLNEGTAKSILTYMLHTEYMVIANDIRGT